MVWNWPEAPGESISTWMNNHVKNCSHMRSCVKLFSCAFHLPDIPFASNYSIFIVVLISEIDNVFEWSNFENSSNYHPNLNNFVPKPTCVDESRLVKKPPCLTPYYSSSLHILRIYALRVTPEPASRSIRFAASAAKFWIWRCLSWPEKQFYQINGVFHNFSIYVNLWSF